jgi:hypothetical protein
MQKHSSGHNLFHLLRNDGKTLANGNELNKGELLYLVDDGVRAHLEKFLGAKGVPSQYAADYKSSLMLHVRELAIGPQKRWAAIVVAMDILVFCDANLLLKGNRSGSCQSLKVTSNYALVQANGDDWIERLGGDAFVQRVRKAFVAEQRRRDGDRRRALADRALGQAYTASMNAALQDSAAQAALRQRLMGR